MKFEHLKPHEIEQKSLQIIDSEMGETALCGVEREILKRVIHTSADFDYVQNLCFSDDAVNSGLEALKNGACILTDTNMAKAGISKLALQALGCEVQCFMSDPEIVETAKRDGTTRAHAAMEKATEITKPLIIAVGNAPTALIRLHQLLEAGKIKPALVIGVPVGFVNVVRSKELILDSGAPYIVAKGRKGGSNVAAAICNALLYRLYQREIPEVARQ